MKLPLRGCLTAFAALAFLYAQTARADIADGGAPADAAVSDATATGRGDAGGPAPGELVTPPELATPTTTATVSTTPLVDTAAPPEQAEPPRPITRRLWFWMAVAGVIVGAVAIGIAVRNPSVSRPDCPTGFVCPP